MDIEGFSGNYTFDETMDIRFAALEYAVAILVAEMGVDASVWNESLPHICRAAALDFGMRLRHSGVPVDPEQEDLMALCMQGFLKAR